MRTIALLSAAALLMTVSPTAAATGAEEADAAELARRMAQVGSCWSPSFSPDGSRLAFVSDLSGVPQIWIVAAKGGWPTRVTALEDQVGGVIWSPDGEWLAFTLDPGGGMNRQVYLIRPDGTGLRRITDGGRESNWLNDWNRDGSLLSLASNRRIPQAMDAWTYRPGDGKLELLAQNPGIGGVVEISSHARRAVLWRMQSRSSNDLVLLDLENGEEALLTPHEGPGSFSGGHFSPDGNSIYLSSNRDGDRLAFARIRLDEAGTPGQIEVLAEREDAELQSFVLADDGGSAILVWNLAGRNELESIDLETLNRTPGPELPAEIVGGYDLSDDDRMLAVTLTGAAAPRDIWIWDRVEGDLRQITHSPHPGVDLMALVRPELLRYRAHDGLELSGWLYRPPGVEEPAPYVLSFHGGPEGQERPRFRGDYQALLAGGIGVFAPNVRGSSGFGKRFVNLDNGKLRYDGIRDIESTVAYLVEADIADSEALGIMGGSYGGYMTMAGLAWYPDLFAAGANRFGVVNFETFFANTEPWMATISTLEYGDPETEAELLRDLSPIHRVDRVTAPTLVLHGANDTNVPVVEAEQVVESLKNRGVPVEYVLFPDEGHGFRKTGNRIRATAAMVEWFERYLKEGEQEAH
jgi:dipeptidyl aminopeptidase/acylaminoacyl peptidase